MQYKYNILVYKLRYSKKIYITYTHMIKKRRTPGKGLARVYYTYHSAVPQPKKGPTICAAVPKLADHGPLRG